MKDHNNHSHALMFSKSIIELKKCENMWLNSNFNFVASYMITEAILIDELSNSKTLNNKSEWSYVRLPHATITREPIIT